MMMMVERAEGVPVGNNPSATISVMMERAEGVPVGNNPSATVSI